MVFVLPLQAPASMLPVSLVSASICITATILRFVATTRSGRKHGKDDWFAFFGLLSFLAFLALNLGNSGLFALEVVTLLKINYALYPLAAVNQFLCKLSVLALYYRIFSVNRRYVFWILSILALEVALTVTTLFGAFLECIPVESHWDSTVPATHCIGSRTFFNITESLNAAIDFVMVALAISMVRDLNMSSGVKRKLFVIFAIGGSSGAIGFAKLGQYDQIADYYLVSSHMILWIVQQATSIICCCAPVYKPLIPEAGLFVHLKSYACSFFLRARRPFNPDPENASQRPHEWLRLERGGRSEGSSVETNAAGLRNECANYHYPGVPSTSNIRTNSEHHNVYSMHTQAT
ncbi:hypothetical protein F4861DRAFT_521999 [Xylaria intraflava]|nr:hypothetical protein F4861DRAFT_521999 [Xylaria intraflava]